MSNADPESAPGTPRPESRFFEFDLLDEHDDDPAGEDREGAGCAAHGAGLAKPEEESDAHGPDNLFDFDMLEEHIDGTCQKADQSVEPPETATEQRDAGLDGASPGESSHKQLSPRSPTQQSKAMHGVGEEPLSSLAAFHEFKELERPGEGHAEGATVLPAHELRDSGPTDAAALRHEKELGCPAKRGETSELEPPSWTGATERPPDALPPEHGDKGCNETLVLVTESSGWELEKGALRFTPVWAGPSGNVRHQLCICLSSEAEMPPSATSPQPENGVSKLTYVSCTFQILNAYQGWDYRIYPCRTPASAKAWGSENLLIPSDPKAVEALMGGEHGHGRYFCIVEPRGTAVTICVDLSGAGGAKHPWVWYERCDAAALGTARPGACVCDRDPVSSHRASAAVKLQGQGRSRQCGELPGTAPGCDKKDPSSGRPGSAATQPSPQSQWPKGAQASHDGLKECRENLVLVCDVTDWDPLNEPLRFNQVWSKDSAVRHQLCLRLAGEGSSGHSGHPLAWESAFVSLTFQILSRDKKWQWRLFPAEVPLRGDGKAWGAENVLVPGSPEAVSVAQGAEGNGLSLHGRDFHIIEPFGTVVTVCVELSVDATEEAPRTVHARVWYEHWHSQSRFTGHDRKPIAKGSVLKALKYRGLDPATEWDRVIKSRCPLWWRRWDKQEQACRRLSLQARKAFEAERAGRLADEEFSENAQKHQENEDPNTSSQKQTAKKKLKPFTKEEALYHLGSCISHLTTNQRVLEECRTCSSVKFGLAESFPFMPPKAMSVMSQMVEEVLKKSGCDTYNDFLERLAFVAWDSSVMKLCDKLSKIMELGEEATGAKRDKEALMVIKDKSTLAACGTRLTAGTRVMLRWQANCDGARYLAYLNGHVGVLVSFDRSSLRWTIGFETFDGHLQVASEHLHVCEETVAAAPDDKKGDSTRKGGAAPECDMCTSRFLDSQLLTIGCPHGHQYCHECLRKWVRRQLVPRCYRCLEDNDALVLPGECSGMPWMAVPKSDSSAGDDYRITKAEIDQLDCICAVEVSGGAQCIILGVQGYIGKRCTVGRVERNKMGNFAAVYLAGGRKLELCCSCLEVDDCLSAGRLAKGEPCPSKGERFGLGLSVASLGCACPVKQTMNELYVEQFAMPFDWLVSRVEGIMYFFRHGFRDFTYFDDIRKDDTYHGFFHDSSQRGQTVEKVGDHGYTSFRTVYHAFPHHDISESESRNAFMRRCDRLLHLVKGALLEATSRPILLVRICARTAELDFSEELYATLRALGGQKIYLLVILTEQRPNYQGAIKHIRHPNLIFYLAGTGGGDLLDSIRFGMDYAYAMDNFGLSDIKLAAKESTLSPIHSAAEIRKGLQHHQIWLNRDKRGEPSLSDINGCFDAGPNQYYPGRFHKQNVFEASPYLSRELQDAVRKGDVLEIAKLGIRGIDMNAWDLRGETLLFAAMRANDLPVCTALLLAAADPNCRDRNGWRPADHILHAEATERAEAKAREEAAAQAKSKAPAPRSRQPNGGAEATKSRSDTGTASSTAIVPLATALSRIESESKGPDARELRSHIRTLLLHWGGLDLVTEDALLAAIAAVPEPDRRRLVARLGVSTPPELLPTKVPVLKLAKSTQVLFTRQMLSQAEAKGEDMVAALLKLRDTAGYGLAERRQTLRVMLRDWHPDKHQDKPKEEQDHANAVFCYIQSMRTIYLGPDEKDAGRGNTKEQ